MHMELARLHLQHFFPPNQLLNVSLQEKQTLFCIIIWRMTTEKGARAVGILRQGAGIRQVSRVSRKCLQSRFPADKCRSLSYTKLNSPFSGRQAFRTPAFNDRWPIQTGNAIDTYCCSIPTTLALSAVVIRRRMMEMLSVFLFSEAFR